MTRDVRGFSVIELIVMMLVIAVVASVALPRALKPSPQQQVDLASRSLMRDLEQMRMRAIATKRSVRVRFYTSSNFYSAFMDVTPERLGTISETSAEVRESGLLTRGSREGVLGVPLPTGVVFGVGAATTGPLGGGVSDPVTLESDLVEFDSRGMVRPPGSEGVVFITHEEDPRAVAAVTISGASAFRVHRYRGARWIR
jgi:type II secretory pathway pseudopilin PulG